MLLFLHSLGLSSNDGLGLVRPRANGQVGNREALIQKEEKRTPFRDVPGVRQSLRRFSIRVFMSATRQPSDAITHTISYWYFAPWVDAVRPDLSDRT